MTGQHSEPTTLAPPGAGRFGPKAAKRSGKGQGAGLEGSDEEGSMSVSATNSASGAQAILGSSGTTATTTTTSTQYKADGSVVVVVTDSRGNVVSETTLVSATRPQSDSTGLAHVDVKA